MNKTASMVLKIIGASLAFAAVICLLARKFGSEYDDYADEELYE